MRRSLIADGYSRTTARVVAWVVRVLNLPFRNSYRAHQVPYDLADELTTTHKWGRGWHTPSAVSRHRTIERFRLEERLRHFLVEFCGPGTVFWDVGACVGNFSIFARSRGAQTYSFEPDGLTFGTLVRNIGGQDSAANYLPVALGNRDEISTLYMRDFATANAYNVVGRQLDDHGQEFKAAGTQSVMVLRGDTLINSHGLQPPTILKVDVDGTELHVLQGMGAWLSDTTLRAVFIESIPDHPDHEAIDLLLREAGFHPRRQPQYADMNVIYERHPGP